jgi:hypothetical protein
MWENKWQLRFLQNTHTQSRLGCQVFLKTTYHLNSNSTVFLYEGTVFPALLKIKVKNVIKNPGTLLLDIREERVEEALEFAGSHLAERGEEDTQVSCRVTSSVVESDPYVFWAFRIRIRHYSVRIRIQILPSSSKKVRKPCFCCFVTFL